MPPKLERPSDVPPITILKFKRQRTTYAIPIQTLEKEATLDQFKALLSTAINGSGGLVLVEKEATEIDEDAPVKSEFEDEDDIPVPKSEFIDEDDNEENIVKVEVGAGRDIVDVTKEDLRLAVPKDKTTPYDNQWIEIGDDSSLASITFNDYDIVAFAFKDEDFYITEAVYED